MEHNSKINKIKIVFSLIYLILSIIILAISILYPKTTQHFSYYTNNILGSSREFFHNMKIGIKAYFHNTNYIEKLEQENLALKEELINIKDIIIKNHLLQEENNELQKQLSLLKSTESYNIKHIITTKILFKNLSNHTATIKFNNKDNILTDNLTVIANNALVGRIVDSSENYSKVLFLTNIKSRIPVYTKENNINAIIVGNNSNDPVLISYDKNQNLQEGNTLLTSGLGGLFPRNIPVGTIYKNDEKWLVKPFNNFKEIFYVQILGTCLKLKN